jgi:outer membrane receptor protein involved in Fe transport
MQSMKQKICWIACLAIFLIPAVKPVVAAQSSDKVSELMALSMDELMSLEITTAGKTEEPISKVPASVVVVTRKDIATYGYRDLTEILENVPGFFNIDDFGDGRANFGIRGFWAGVDNANVIIMVNGIRQFSDTQSYYPLEMMQVPVEAIDRIEIVRGPMSVIYGQGAFFGAINIITNQSRIAGSDQMTVAGSLGNLDTKKLFARFEKSDGNNNLVVNASVSANSGLDVPYAKMVSDVATLSAVNVSADATTRDHLEVNEKYFNASGSMGDIHFEAAFVQTISGNVFAFPMVGRGTVSKQHRVTTALGYRKKLSDTFSMNGKLYYMVDRFAFDFGMLSEDFYGNEQIGSEAVEFDLNTFYTPTPKVELRSGLTYRNALDVSNRFNLPSFGSTDFVNTFQRVTDGGIVTRSIFSQLRVDVTPDFQLIGGLRLEQMPKYELTMDNAGGTEVHNRVVGYYDRDQVDILPRFAAMYSINELNVCKILYGEAINRPSFFSNVRNISDPFAGQLKPEKIRTIEINYLGTWHHRANVSLSVFRNSFKDLTVRVVDIDEEFNYRSFFHNAGSLITKGMELTLQLEPASSFKIEVSGTWQQTDNTRPDFEDIAVAYSPRKLGYFKASWIPHADFSIGLTGNYVDGMKALWDNGLQDTSNPTSSTIGRIGDDVDGYLKTGLHFRWENIGQHGLYAGCKISNLFNQEIRYTTYTNNDWADRGTLGFSRQVLFNLGKNF